MAIVWVSCLVSDQAVVLIHFGVVMCAPSVVVLFHACIRCDSDCTMLFYSHNVCMPNTTAYHRYGSDNNGTIIGDFSAVCWGMGRRIAQWYASKVSDTSEEVDFVR